MIYTHSLILAGAMFFGVIPAIGAVAAPTSKPYVPVLAVARLCAPAVPRDVKLDAGFPFSTADSYLERGDYRTTARAYYQVFRCSNAPLSNGINPLVEDSGFLGAFDVALAQAADGNYRSAIGGLQRILNVMPQFGEARFLIGIYSWALGDHAGARAAWKATVSTQYFTLPPDDPGNDDSYQIPVKAAARDMLTWSRGK